MLASKKYISSFDHSAVSLILGWQALSVSMNCFKESSPFSQMKNTSSIYLHHIVSHDGENFTNCCTSLTVLKFFYWTERCCYMVFTTEGFFEIAIESRPERNLNPRPLNSFQTLYPTELSYLRSTRTQSKLCTATLISSLSSVFTFHFGHCLRQSPNLSPI